VLGAELLPCSPSCVSDTRKQVYPCLADHNSSLSECRKNLEVCWNVPTGVAWWLQIVSATQHTSVPSLISVRGGCSQPLVWVAAAVCQPAMWLKRRLLLPDKRWQRRPGCTGAHGPTTAAGHDVHGSNKVSICLEAGGISSSICSC